MNAMLTDDDLTRLLGEAAESFDVPAEGPPTIQRDLAPAVPLHQRGVFKAGTAAAGLVAFVLLIPLVGGGSTSSSTASKSSSGFSGQVTAPQLDAGGTTGGTTGGATSDALTPAGTPLLRAPETGGRSALGLSGTPTGAHAAPGTTTTAGKPTTTTGVDGGDTRVVKTGTVTLLADKGRVAPTVVQAKAALAGARGYVANENSQPIGDNPTATVTMRVPVASFETLEAQLQKLGAKVVSVTSSGKDVTATYADTEAQIGSLKAARSRFLTILAGANTIGETLTVQQRVDDVQSQIDRLEGQRRLLLSQSDLATITMSVSEKPPATVKVQSKSGLDSSWDKAKHGFSSGVEGLISRSGRTLVVLLVLGVLLVVLRFGWRLARRRML